MSQTCGMSDEAVEPGSGVEGDPHLLGPGLLPTPFTAEEIRAASGTGKTIRLLVDLPDGARFERVNRFSDIDADGATLEQWRVDDAGQVDGVVTSERVTWRELQEHAAFPAEHATRSGTELETPMGVLDCLHYEVRHGDEPPQLSRFWFARDYPGMPVRYEIPTPSGVVRTTVTSIEVEPQTLE